MSEQDYGTKIGGGSVASTNIVGRAKGLLK